MEDAPAAWPSLEATGLGLGSPTTVHPDNDWIPAFMKGVKRRGLRVDFICAHSHGRPDVDFLLGDINSIHEMFKRPIWITEFFSALLPILEAMPIVEGYAWFHGGESGGPLPTSPSFHANGSNTPVGKAYRGTL